MKQDWIFEENRFSWLEIVASFCGYAFEAGDRDAFEVGIQNTNHEQERWFDYEFSSFSSLKLQLARDLGSSVIFAKAHCSPDLQPKIATTTQIAQEYRLTRR
ncbi:hypothetical protein H6F67_24160 [Microcoleus sp. FACHB-1515]|uniref:hypothetical protein n=1 Tax=Cyanophyceae TaxID=3028117 RepID=UPI0016892136|nr:hypothetical protein [Microcoleus sp. FACHB-1515]MBD2092947.1 hypothetical protein [Microcoleus sp. FACHB-1515]